MVSLPLVSILIPAYNAERYIAETIESALSQTWPNKEIIVVNDGSTDNTLAITRAFENRGVRIVSQQNKGQCAAANLAFRESKGSLIKFLDADDILSPNNISLQVEILKGENNYIASCEWGRFYGKDYTQAKFNYEKVWRKGDIRPIDWIIDSMSEGLNMMQCAIWLIPRCILEKSGLWNEKLSLINDFEFFIRVLLHAEGIRFTPEARLYYRSGIASSLSRTKSRKALESAFLSISLGTDLILKTENSDRTRKICADVFQVWAFNFYPSCLDLCIMAESRIRELGGSEVKLPGGSLLKLLRSFVGWKKAKNIQDTLYTNRYLKLLKNANSYYN